MIESIEFICMETKDLIRSWINWKSAQIQDVYTQDMLAKDSGIWPSSITDYIKGKREPSRKSIEKISKAIGITVPEFWAGPEVYESRKFLKEVSVQTEKRIVEFKDGEHISGLGIVKKIDASQTIPLLTSIPAGHWKEWIDSQPAGFGEDMVPRYDVQGEHVFAVRVKCVLLYFSILYHLSCDM